ncbi:MAG TPA: FecR family protein [Anaerolineales bacterium]
MPTLPSLLRLLAILVCLVSAFNIRAAAAAAVGKVTQVQNQAQVGGKTAVVGTPVYLNDRLRTGAKARLKITFSDQSELTLGENANVVVDHFVYNPSKSKGEVVLSATQGALRFAGGKIENMQHKKVLVKTPSAALAVRGTHFWAGPIDGQYGVLLLTGKLNVSNKGGAVTLSRPGQGTDIPYRRRRH